MDILDLLGGEVAALPKMRDAAKDYLAYLREDVLEPFLADLGKLDANDPVTKSVRHHRSLCKPVCDCILEAVDLYLKGFPHRAYEKIAEAISRLGPHFKALGAVGDMQKNLRHCYRIQSSPNPSLDRGRSFHIPFELRHKVKTQRYSIPGLPSLYLGGSLYVCWAEYGRPALDDIHVARFEATDELRLINFGYHPLRMAGLIATMYDSGKVNDSVAAFVIAQTIAWPLVASCSIQVPDRTVDFKAEYIVPQIVLQWVRVEGEFDGIRYFSTHIDDVLNDPVGQVNYVFPVQSSHANGRCSVLNSKFRLSVPYPCRAFGGTGVLPFADCPHMNFQIRRNGPGDVLSDYGVSDLGQIQRYVSTLDTDFV